MINQTEYIHALESFLISMEQIETQNADAVRDAVRELCQVLHIGKITLRYLNTADIPDVQESVVFYQADSAFPGESVRKRFSAPNMAEIEYEALPETENSWTDEIRQKTGLLLNTLFSFNARVKLMQVTQKLLCHDRDLDIPNMRYFDQYIAELVKSGKDFSGYASVFFNFKHFSVINQQIGRDKGTLVMKRYVHRIKELLDEQDEIIFRVGGDNFAILLKKEKMPSVIRILEGTGICYDSSGRDRVLVTATAGVCYLKDIKIRNSSDILDKTSLASYTARYQSSQDIVVFNDQMLEYKKRNVRIENMFPEAIRNEEFLVYYQPKISLDGFRIAGAEALCRWQHDGRLIPPGEFIPVLEQGMEICTLDFYMLEHVCRDIRRWLDEGRSVVRISVNLSRRHMTDMDLLEHILKIVDENQVPHQYIEIELTETTTDVEFKDLKRVVAGLQKQGISTSVDDFGIGYSSLNLIKEIPWNVLKVDKSFLPNADDTDKSMKEAVFRHVIAMAQEMGLECIAEGVETKEQVDLLLANCCNLAQGFLFDRPLPVGEFENRLGNYAYHCPES